MSQYVFNFLFFLKNNFYFKLMEPTCSLHKLLIKQLSLSSCQVQIELQGPSSFNFYFENIIDDI